MAKPNIDTRPSTDTPVPRIRMLIGGTWREGSDERDIVNPYSGEIVARAPESSLQDLDDALRAATAAKKQAGGDAWL